VSDKQVSERVLSTASGVFHCSQQAVRDTAKFQDLSGWDSIAHLNFILALEQEFGCSFTEDEMELFTSIRSVIEVIDAKQPS
jgi:acyl carrier protein